MTATSKLYELRIWLDADQTNRDYASKTDREVAQDLQTEMVSRGGVTHWDLLDDIFGNPATRTEYANQHDGDVSAEGATAEGRRSRVVGLLGFLGGAPNQNIPGEHYNTVKRFVGQTFGAGSQIKSLVDTRLDNDEVTRARWLGFGRRDEDKLTDDVTAARALPTPEPSVLRTVEPKQNGRRSR